MHHIRAIRFRQTCSSSGITLPGRVYACGMVYGLGRFGNRFGGLELWGFWLGFVRVQRRGVRCLGLIQACGANP